MKRKIITIDEEKCDGCGLCVKACHEGALGIVHGKARLLRDDYCDGMGDCLPECPQGAIAFEERETAPYNGYGAPRQAQAPQPGRPEHAPFANFPIQIKLAPPNAPRFRGCDLLVAADCTAFMAVERGRAADKQLVIGCPKLDNTDYSDKLAEIISSNGVRSVTVARMEVPCCGALVRMAETAIAKSGADIPLNTITVTVGGEVQ
jgi:ferredoxin